MLFPRELTKNDHFWNLAVWGNPILHWRHFQAGVLAVAEENVNDEGIIFEDLKCQSSAVIFIAAPLVENWLLPKRFHTPVD